MKKIFLALMAVAAIALTGCENPNNDPNPPENKRDDFIQCTCTCTCGNKFILSATRIKAAYTEDDQPDYKVYASGGSNTMGSLITIEGQSYPLVTYNEYWKYEAYCFWRCECGRYHKVMRNNLTHTEIPDGEQPDEWNEFNYLWE